MPRDYQIDLPLLHHIGQPVLQHLPARRTYNVADKQYTHRVGVGLLQNKKSGLLGRGELGREPLD